MDCFCAIWDFVTLAGIIKTIELGLTAFGCYVAWRALSTWREQVMESPKIELAREIVEQFYNMKDLISRARNPFISFSPDEVRKFYEMDNLTEYQTGLAYRLMILDKSVDQIQAFQKLRNKAKVLYSKEIENCFFEVNKIINLFQQACKAMMEETSIKGLDKDVRKDFFDRVYNQGDGDTTDVKIQNIIDEVEYNLKPLYASKIITWHKIKG